MTEALGQYFLKPLDNGIPIPKRIDDVVDVLFPRVVEEAAKASRVWKIWVIESLAAVSGESYRHSSYSRLAKKFIFHGWSKKRIPIRGALKCS